jgi:flavodoxin
MIASKVLVVYYSRTGATRRLAEVLAKALQADIEPIIDKKNRSGIFGYLRSLSESLQKRAGAVEPMKTDPRSYDLVVIGTPVWAWSVSSPVRSYLVGNRGRLPDVAFLCTMGSRGSERAFEEMQAIAGKAPRAGCAVTAREVASEAYGRHIAQFMEQLKTQGFEPAFPP